MALFIAALSIQSCAKDDFGGGPPKLEQSDIVDPVPTGDDIIIIDNEVTLE